MHVAFADTQSPDGSGEYVPQLTYPPRTEQRYRPDVEAMKDERRLSASTLGSKRESAVPAPEQPRRVRNKFSVWLDRVSWSRVTREGWESVDLGVIRALSWFHLCADLSQFVAPVSPHLAPRHKLYMSTQLTPSSSRKATHAVCSCW